jgi:hypothetical protein
MPNRRRAGLALVTSCFLLLGALLRKGWPHICRELQRRDTRVRFLKSRGSTVVEAAATLGVFLFTAITIVDLAQLTVMEQALVERARVGARYAALRGINPSAVVNVVLYNNPDADGGGHALFHLGADSVSVERLDANTSADRVRVSIRDFQLGTFSPFLRGRILPHTFSATVPVESLGAVD